jgi:hypothetical protein
VVDVPELRPREEGDEHGDADGGVAMTVPTAEPAAPGAGTPRCPKTNTSFAPEFTLTKPGNSGGSPTDDQALGESRGVPVVSEHSGLRGCTLGEHGGQKTW